MKSAQELNDQYTRLCFNHPAVNGQLLPNIDNIAFISTVQIDARQDLLHRIAELEAAVMVKDKAINWYIAVTSKEGSKDDNPYCRYCYVQLGTTHSENCLLNKALTQSPAECLKPVVEFLKYAAGGGLDTKHKAQQLLSQMGVRG